MNTSQKINDILPIKNNLTKYQDLKGYLNAFLYLKEHNLILDEPNNTYVSKLLNAFTNVGMDIKKLEQQHISIIIELFIISGLQLTNKTNNGIYAFLKNDKPVNSNVVTEIISYLINFEKDKNLLSNIYANKDNIYSKSNGLEFLIKENPGYLLECYLNNSIQLNIEQVKQSIKSLLMRLQTKTLVEPTSLIVKNIIESERIPTNLLISDDYNLMSLFINEKNIPILNNISNVGSKKIKQIINNTTLIHEVIKNYSEYSNFDLLVRNFNLDVKLIDSDIIGKCKNLSIISGLVTKNKINIIPIIYNYLSILHTQEGYRRDSSKYNSQKEWDTFFDSVRNDPNKKSNEASKQINRFLKSVFNGRSYGTENGIIKKIVNFCDREQIDISKSNEFNLFKAKLSAVTESNETSFFKTKSLNIDDILKIKGDMSAYFTMAVAKDSNLNKVLNYHYQLFLNEEIQNNTYLSNLKKLFVNIIKSEEKLCHINKIINEIEIGVGKNVMLITDNNNKNMYSYIFDNINDQKTYSIVKKLLLNNTNSISIAEYIARDFEQLSEQQQDVVLDIIQREFKQDMREKSQKSVNLLFDIADSTNSSNEKLNEKLKTIINSIKLTNFYPSQRSKAYVTKLAVYEKLIIKYDNIGIFANNSKPIKI